jgi:peptidoglycan/LPS O-acetylase OafA/YrhL
MSDISYGFYLFAYPLQQTTCAIFKESLPLYPLMLIALTGTILMASLSWHLVERPVLELKKTILTKRSGFR